MNETRIQRKKGLGNVMERVKERRLLLHSSASRRGLALGSLLAVLLFVHGCGGASTTVAPSAPFPTFKGAVPDLRVTNTWLHTDLHDIVLDAVQDSPIQIVLSATARGHLSVHVEEMPFEQFLDIVTAAAGVKYWRFDENTYVIVQDEAPRVPDVELTGQTGSERAFHVTNEWFDEDVRNIITDVMQESGFQYAISDAIVGRLTLRVEEMPLDSFLRLVTSTVNATFKRIGADLYYIGPKSPPKGRD